MSQLLFKFDRSRPLDVICMGRVAVDLYAEQIGVSLAEASSFRKYIGGCAGNIAVGTARLGLHSAMLSKVGADAMGQFITNTLDKEGVDTRLLSSSVKHLTGLVLLGICPPDHFPLIFYRNDCADMQLKTDDCDEAIIRQAKALLVTGTGFSSDSMHQTSHFAIDIARRNSTAIILDIDYRPVLWGLTDLGDGKSRFAASQRVSNVLQSLLPKVDLVVGTEEEFLIAGGSTDITTALRQVRALSHAPLVLKKGSAGCTIYTDDLSTPIEVAPFPVEVLNVLGAGDAFMSGLLRGLLRGESWHSSGSYANACGAIVVTRHGCAPAIPNYLEMDYFIQEYPNNPNVWQCEDFNRLHEMIETA